MKILVILVISFVSCGVLRLVEGQWRAGFILISFGCLAGLTASILSRRPKPVAYGLDSMDAAMGNRSPIQRGANVGHLKPMEWEYHPQKVMVVEAWSIGPYFISKQHDDQFYLVKGHVLLGVNTTLKAAMELAEKDRRES